MHYSCLRGGMSGRIADGRRPPDGPPNSEVHMEERDFSDEKAEQRTHVMTCPHCGQQGEYQIDWVVRRKKPQLPRGADDRDRARFAKAHSYVVPRTQPIG